PREQRRDRAGEPVEQGHAAAGGDREAALPEAAHYLARDGVGLPAAALGGDRFGFRRLGQVFLGELRGVGVGRIDDRDRDAVWAQFGAQRLGEAAKGEFRR